MNRIIKATICCLMMAGISLPSIGQTVIKLRKQGNVYIIPCKVNGYQLNMFFDTGADDVSLSLKDALEMIKNGYISESDIIGKASYTTANGDVAEGTKINIRKITFAGIEIKDVAATIMHTMDAPLLFGQSAIGKLGKIQIDPSESTLTIVDGKKGKYDYSKGDDPGKEEVVVVKTTDREKPYTTSTKAPSSSTMRQVMTLHIDRDGGANGANIAWHPVYKRYYAAMAGNVSFPMEVFDANGKMISPNTLETMFDVRGFWYNTTAKALQVNGYNDFGLAEYELDSKGMPAEARKLNVDASQPNSQSVGAYDPQKQLLYFYDMQTVGIEPHRLSDGVVYKTIHLYLGITSMAASSDMDQDEVKYNYNENALIFSGIPQAEVGLLNVAKKQVELYDLGSGLMTKTLKLPQDAPVQSSLNFSYCNGIYWLFDKETRVWHGYR